MERMYILPVPGIPEACFVAVRKRFVLGADDDMACYCIADELCLIRRRRAIPSILNEHTSLQETNMVRLLACTLLGYAGDVNPRHPRADIPPAFTAYYPRARSIVITRAPNT